MRYFLVIFLVLSTYSSAADVKLACKVTSTKTEVSSADLKEEDREDLRALLGAKSAEVTLNQRMVTLVLSDKDGKRIYLPEHYQNKETLKWAYRQVSEINLVVKKEPGTESKKKKQAQKVQKDLAFANDALSVLDDSFGVHFHFYIDKSALEPKAQGTITARIWTAAVGEPDDDTGYQALFDHSVVRLSCGVK